MSFSGGSAQFQKRCWQSALMKQFYFPGYLLGFGAPVEKSKYNF